MSKRIVVILAVIWMVLLVAGVSTSLTLALSGAEGVQLAERLTDGQGIVVTQDEYATISRYQRLDEVLRMIQSEYYTETDEDKLVLGAIRGMVDALDDQYSFYRTPDEMAQEQEQQDGVYYGVGMQLLIGEDHHLLITRVFSGSPSEKAGIRAGDVLTVVAGIDLSQSEDPMETAKSMLSGDEPGSVEVEVERDGEKLSFEVWRAEIVINRVVYSMLEGDIGYIAIYEFLGDDVDGFKAALDALTKQGAKALVIDLRGNPGGLLNDVVEVADRLLGEGMIVYVESRSGSRDNYYSDKQSCGVPLAVLVNGTSASASEIMAGAVQDSGAGVIVGETTFGKGIVQSIIPFPSDGAGIHLTTASYFTPSGRSIHGSGIEPDIPVTLAEGDEITPEKPQPEKDAQLKKAVDYLLDALEKPDEE